MHINLEIIYPLYLMVFHRIQLPVMTNKTWEIWINNFIAILDKHAQTRKVKAHCRYSRWSTEEIKRMMYKRDFLKKRQNKRVQMHFSWRIKKLEIMLTN